MAERLLDETVILDPQTDRYTRLNATGSRLWEELGEAPSTAGRLAAALVEEFRVPESRALGDVASFLGELERRGLVTLER
jgi:Coenzyme PQQ synthesis protein D (PqqD)